MRTYLVWRPDIGETVDDAGRVEAIDAHTAAEEYAAQSCRRAVEWPAESTYYVTQEGLTKGALSFKVRCASEPVFHASEMTPVDMAPAAPSEGASR